MAQRLQAEERRQTVPVATVVHEPEYVQREYVVVKDRRLAARACRSCGVMFHPDPDASQVGARAYRCQQCRDGVTYGGLIWFNLCGPI